MSRTDYPKDGQAMGEIRTPISLDKLQPYLEKNIDGFAGPITIKQFGVSKGLATTGTTGICSGPADQRGMSLECLGAHMLTS